jgi:hypothetical protein
MKSGIAEKIATYKDTTGLWVDVAGAARAPYSNILIVLDCDITKI